MLLASWAFDSVEKRLRSFDTENLGSVGQRAAKLPAIKLWRTVTLGPTDPRLQYLNNYTKNQEAVSILKVSFVLSEWPHLHRVYLVTVC